MAMTVVPWGKERGGRTGGAGRLSYIKSSYENTSCRVAERHGTENFDHELENQKMVLDHFVVFSSVSAGQGNAGQANYGYANSGLDSLVRARNSAGKCGLSVQWGAIGDVGVLAKVGGGLLCSWLF